MFAGYLAREMGLPVASLICANNKNATVHRIFKTNRFSRESLQQTPSNAIDIALPYNFWRFLYFVSGQNSEVVKRWMSDLQENGYVEFNEAMMKGITHGFLTAAVSDEETLSVISEVFGAAEGYLLDPHGAVAVAAAKKAYPSLSPETKVVSLLTAHPAKFPDITRRALDTGGDLPPAGRHDSIEKARNQFQQVNLCDCSQLKEALIHGLTKQSLKARW